MTPSPDPIVQPRLGAGAKLLLAAEIVSAYGGARWRLRRFGLPGALERLRTPRSPATRHQKPDPLTTARLARAVGRTLTVLPADSRCLMRSLVLTRLLAQRGIESQLVIAVRPGERFAAHAWVEHDGEPLLPPSRPPFEQLLTL